MVHGCYVALLYKFTARAEICDVTKCPHWCGYVAVIAGGFQLFKSLGKRATGRYTEYRGGRSSGVYIQRKST